MDLKKYTEKAQEAILAAQQLAEQSSHAQIEPEHLLVALVEQREGIVPELLRQLGADPVAVGRAARELLSQIPQAYGGSSPALSPRLKLVTDLAQAEADRLKDEFVSTEHLFIAVASETGRSPAAKLLDATGRHPRQDLPGADQRAGIAACDQPESGRDLSSTPAVRPRSDGAG